MSVPSINRIRDRLLQLRTAPERVARAAAPRIEAKFRADATTKRGNVPSFGAMGNVPIRAEVRPEAILVHGPDWCIDKAVSLGQVDQWVAIVHEEAARIMGAK